MDSEWECLLSLATPNSLHAPPSLVNDLCRGDVESIAVSASSKDFLRLNNLAINMHCDLESSFKHHIEHILIRADQSTATNLICVSISLLYLFIRVNWTGPYTTLAPMDLIFEQGSENHAKFSNDHDYLKLLMCDEEECYALVDRPLFLLLALWIFEVMVESRKESSWRLDVCCFTLFLK